MPPRSRRGRGEGSIYQLLDGRWTCAVSVGYGPDGRRRRRIIHGKSKAEVQKKLAEMQVKAPTSIEVDAGRLTVDRYLEQWLATDARARCRERTLESHERAVRDAISPRIGRTPLSKLSAMHIQMMFAELEDEGRSAHVRNSVRKTLHRALNRAVRLGMLAQNPCSLVDNARVPHRTLEVLSPEQAHRFLEASKGDRLHALYVLALTTGMRQGELFGLQWNDLDLKSRSLTVQRALDRNGDFAEPKTARARRGIDLPEMAIAALKRHWSQMQEEGHGSDLVFCDSLGGPLRHSNVTRRSFKVILKVANLPDIRFHDLRHSHASLLLLQGENPKVVQERLGHSKIELTLGTYSHLLPGIQRAAADRLGELLDAAKAPARG